MKKQVAVVLGSGVIALAIARRVSIGKHILLADLHLENAEKAAKACVKLVLNAAQWQ